MPPPQRKSISNLMINSKKRKRIARTSRETSCECCRRRKLKCTSARPACSICLRSAQLHGLDPNDAVCHYSIESIHTIDYDRTVDQALKQGCCVVDRDLKQQLAAAISQLTDKQKRGELDPVHRKKRKALDHGSSSSDVEESCALETAREQISAPRRSTRSFAPPDLASALSTKFSPTPCRSSPSPPHDHPSPVSSLTSSSPLSSLADDTPLNIQDTCNDELEEAIPDCREEATDPKIKTEPENEPTASSSQDLAPAPLSPSCTASPSPSLSGLAHAPKVCPVFATLDSGRVKELEDVISNIKESLTSTPTASTPPPSLMAGQGGSSETTTGTELAEFDLDRHWKPPLLLSEEFWLPGPLRKEELYEWRVLEGYGMIL